jgi:hypothetical protein
MHHLKTLSPPPFPLPPPLPRPLSPPPPQGPGMAKVSKVSGPFRALWNLLGILTLLLGLSAAWLIGSQALRSAAAGNLGMGGSVVTSSAAAAAPSASSASSAGEDCVQQRLSRKLTEVRCLILRLGYTNRMHQPHASNAVSPGTGCICQDIPSSKSRLFVSSPGSRSGPAARVQCLQRAHPASL